jgi:hypothetical protein
MANREREKRFVDFMEDVQYNIFLVCFGLADHRYKSVFRFLCVLDVYMYIDMNQMRKYFTSFDEIITTSSSWVPGRDLL